jgi:hypothetical protein
MACGDREEGCLDIKAENFDASADKDCCCDYPDLLMNVQHTFDTISFKLDSAYHYPNGDTFSIKDLYIMVSEVHPLAEGLPYSISDTINIGVNDALGQELLVLENNFATLCPTRYTHPIGTFQYPGQYEGVSLRLGVNDEVNRILPDSVYISGHPLKSDTDSLWAADGGYFAMRIQVAPQASNPDVLRDITVWSDGYTKEFNINGNVSAELGYDSNFNIKIDYKTLFDGIDFEADTESLISTKLSDNLPFSIQITD